MLRVASTNFKALWCFPRTRRVEWKVSHAFGELTNSEFSEFITCKSLRETTAVVTVAISLFNYGDYIIPCLESVKTQTLNDLDLIVVDDCSTDDSLKVVVDWLAKNEN